MADCDENDPADYEDDNYDDSLDEDDICTDCQRFFSCQDYCGVCGAAMCSGCYEMGCGVCKGPHR